MDNLHTQRISVQERRRSLRSMEEKIDKYTSTLQHLMYIRDHGNPNYIQPSGYWMN